MSVAVDVIALARGELVAGHYRIEGTLGEGGMGIVVAAHDETTGERVAIKLLRGSSDLESTDRFFRELRTMSRLDSPHVVRVRSSGATASGAPYIVMERLEGSTLADYVRTHGSMPVREAADCMVQVCEALSHAHSKGIVHRDIKPSNIFLHRTPDGAGTIVKVLDFGISKVLSREQWERTLTASGEGSVLGSPLYMSPEQVRSPSNVDPRTDIWSLGVVMYRVLTGELPFDGDSVGGIFAQILETPVTPAANLPPELVGVVLRCLAKNRDQRFADVGDLVRALSPFASPAYAGIAGAIVRRLQEEGPTIRDRPSVVPTGREESPTVTYDPRTAPPVSSQRRSAPPFVLPPFVPPPLVPGPPVARASSRPQIVALSFLLAAVVAVGSLAVVIGRHRANRPFPPWPAVSVDPNPSATVALAPSAIAPSASEGPLPPPTMSAPAEAASSSPRPDRKPRGQGRRGPTAPSSPAAATSQQLQPSPYGAP